MIEKDCENNKYPLLSLINSPEDLNKISNIPALCGEIREKLIEVISKNGGHLSPNLGVVELTVALYKVFGKSENKIVWDVGHQCYVHKMLTGRFKDIDNIRQQNGISGFTNRSESKYDIFTSGHSSTSISAALGLARAKKILGESGKVIAVIGDGALTGGLAYEGLNNVQKLKNFVIILNDNSMSISKNVGAVARYLAAARIRPTYMKAKNILESILEKTQMGLKIERFMNRSKSVVKNFIYKKSIFEDMGLAYYGPIDGHNLEQLERALNITKNINKPIVLHVITNKGKGYEFAEKNPKGFHAMSPFDVNTGVSGKKSSLTFSEVFGNKLCELSKKDIRICAITAAMSSGTGLSLFKNQFKSRFFDVGIAEGHAVTFASGLSAGGLIPVFAVYSSFLQRSYDQLIHDASLQGLKMVLAVDRAGLIGEDGEAHQGLFDVSFLNTIPNVKIYSPSFFEELENNIEDIFNDSENKISVVRYPRGGEFFKPTDFKCSNNDFDLYGDKNSNILIITYGRIFSEACICQENFKKIGINVCILKLNVIKPINPEALSLSANFKNIFFFEESIKSGGVAEKFGSLILENTHFRGKYNIQAIPDKFVAHTSIREQLKRFSLDSEGMIKVILENKI